ncbi:NADPH-dependent FMN reductase [Trichoderma velutinum]
MANMKSIAIIVGTTRTPRAGPNIAKFVEGVIRSKADSTNISLSIIEIAHFDLPIFNEPILPQAIRDPNDYFHEHTRRWAREIAKHDGYIIVSAEYNYCIPGVLKNAIDFIYNEWKGKSIAIITYGIKGGYLASEALGVIFTNLSFKVTPTRPQLTFPGGAYGPEAQGAATTGQLGGLTIETWNNEKSAEILKAFEELKEYVLQPTNLE